MLTFLCLGFGSIGSYFPPSACICQSGRGVGYGLGRRLLRVDTPKPSHHNSPKPAGYRYSRG
ncbi:hypothetical protein [Psychrobacter sp. KH172YL61]|uniref:hypothetical protein n=1 Tax=Psychrobacter sp. KH172YL61 TaxID=2517899 RepID=UPI001F073989|nr:hypothetical protein [Psychrobacter sp. KH172YL61]